MEYLFYLGRVLYGGFFIMSGMNHFRNSDMLAQYTASKGVPMPKLMVILSGLLIFVGGLWIVTGTFVQAGIFEIVTFLVIVSFKMHDFWNDTDPMQKMMNRTQFMKNMALLGAALMMLQIPVGALGWGWNLF